MSSDIKGIKPEPFKEIDDTPHPESRAEKDLRLWHQWKTTNEPGHLKALLRAYDPVVHKFVSNYMHSGVPLPALEAEAKLNAVKAFKTYDPGRGTQLNTHVTNYLQKTQRLAREQGGLTRIPEHRSIRMSTYLSVRDYLKEKIGRDPSMAELREELMASRPITDHKDHWSEAEIGRMEKELHKTLLSSVDELADIGVQSPSEEAKLLDYIYYELNPQEQAVYEYLVGVHGKPRLDGISIAKKLNMTPSRVSRIRQRIAEKFETHRNK